MQNKQVQLRVLQGSKTFLHWGRHGFDVGYKALGACRGTAYLVKPTVKLLVANDDNYALAA